MIEVKWRGQRVAKIENDRLIEATEAFENIWREFKANGVTRIGPADPPDNPDPNILADGYVVTYALGALLSDLQLGGYEVIRTGPDTLEARIAEAQASIDAERPRQDANN